VVYVATGEGDKRKVAAYEIWLTIERSDVEYIFETDSDEQFQWPDVVFCSGMGDGVQDILDRIARQNP
jgi:hypothetical protein